MAQTQSSINPLSHVRWKRYLKLTPLTELNSSKGRVVKVQRGFLISLRPLSFFALSISIEDNVNCVSLNLIVSYLGKSIFQFSSSKLKFRSRSLERGGRKDPERSIWGDVGGAAQLAFN